MRDCLLITNCGYDMVSRCVGGCVGLLLNDNNRLCLLASLLVCLFVNLFVRLLVDLPACLFVDLFVYQLACLFAVRTPRSRAGLR